MYEIAVQRYIIQFFISDLSDRVQSVLQSRHLLFVLENLTFQILSFVVCHHRRKL